MERVKDESFWFCRPDFADVFVGRETLECLKTLCEVVGSDEVGEMSPKFVMGFIIEALDGGVLDGAVHPLDLAIRPRVLGLGQAMIDGVASAGHFKGRSSEWLAALKHAFDIGDRPTLALRVSEVRAVVSQHGMDLVGDRFDEIPQKVGCDLPCGFDLR